MAKRKALSSNLEPFQQPDLNSPSSSSSSRVTRSAARIAAGQSSTQPNTSESTPSRPNTRSRKRRASPSSPASETQQSAPLRRSKRQRLQEPEAKPEELELNPAPLGRARSLRSRTTMSTSGPSDVTGEAQETNAESSSTRRKSWKGKKSVQETSPHTPQPQSTSRRSKKPSRKSDEATMLEGDESPKPTSSKGSAKKPTKQLLEEEQIPRDLEQDDEDEDMIDNEPSSIREELLSRGVPPSLSSHARSLIGGLMPSPGIASKVRGFLDNIKNHEDPTMQLLAMQEFADFLLITNEDALNGQFSPDSFVKEFVLIMKGGELGLASPEMMDWACRCITNLLEALPQTAHSVVAGGTIPVLCEKLKTMEYMEQAEQAMLALSKISEEYPGAIVREGGLSACLMFLDFFPTYMQKTAVGTAAKCCFDLSDSSLPAVLDAMPTLHNVLNNSDQEVVKQGALCITRIVSRYGNHSRLEELVSSDLLKTIFRLLLPGSINIVGVDIQTRFLSLLATIARASPSLAGELLKMDVVDTLYQVLTGISPPEGDDDISSRIDGVLVMQALIHKPRDQIFGALNVICEILPDATTQELMTKVPAKPDLLRDRPATQSKRRQSASKPRMDLLESHKDKVKRFVMILLPTLTHAYDITVNLSVRKTVLNAQLKMLSNVDSSILESALSAVPFASFLASILSQQDHTDLVVQALEAVELLLYRLKSIYAYQFCREGVLAEITKLASQPLLEKPQENAGPKDENVLVDLVETDAPRRDSESEDDNHESDSEQDAEDREDDDDDEEGDVQPEYRERASASPSSSSDEDFLYSNPVNRAKDRVTKKARKILETYQDSKGSSMRSQADQILSDARALAGNLRKCYMSNASTSKPHGGRHYFQTLAQYFNNDALESITSAELLNSGILDVLLDVLDSTQSNSRLEAKATFVETFMGIDRNQDVQASHFSILVHKLQDLLSRAEHLEVATVHNNSQETTRMDRDNLSYQLGKQLRLKLEAEDGSDIPDKLKSFIVSIHAITTFKSLNDYLRPKMGRDSSSASRRGEMISTLAALAGASGGSHHQRLLERTLLGRTEPSSISNTAGTSKTQPPKPPREKPSSGHADQAPQTPVAQDKSGNKRSSRRHQSGKSPSLPEPPSLLAPPAQTFAQSSALSQEPLECADEKPLADEEADNNEDDDALDAFVEDLEDEMDDEPTPDPGAVNLEIASTGKVTARQEDGTRVPTPAQTLTPLSALASPPGRIHGSIAGPLTTSRSLSYAAVAQSVPQDWHLAFSIDGHEIPLDTTIYRAVHYNKADPTELNSRSVWSAVHAIKYKKAPGPPSTEQSSLVKSSNKSKSRNGLPESLHNSPLTSQILRLLDILHDLNSNLSTILEGRSDELSRVQAEPVAQFVNTKLTAKLNRQLEEPLIVASKCLPQWSEDLVRLYPFLFPFEARYLFLQSNYFGYSRAIERWMNAQSDDNRRERRRDDTRPYLSVPKKQKVRIQRDRLFDSAMKVMELYGHSLAALEIEYFEEVGTGLGPTLEFFSNVSKEFAKKKHKLWRENEGDAAEEYAFGKFGLFPAPMSEEQAQGEHGKRVLQLFKMLGKFVARSMLDGRMIDISFNPLFFRLGNWSKAAPLTTALVRYVDEDLAMALKNLERYVSKKKVIESKYYSMHQKPQAQQQLRNEIDSLVLDFTLPGYPDIELIKNGSALSVNAENLELYLEKVVDFTLGSGIKRQIQEFQNGFTQVFPYSSLNSFTPAELVMLFGNPDEDWSIETLMDSIRADHGFHMDSKSVRNLLQLMSELDLNQRRLFLQFVTGSPKLPIGGFKKLMPIFTVVHRKNDEGNISDDYLPSVMTCTNYLKLPDYSDLHVMRRRLQQAIREGQGAFHLS